MIDSEEYTYEVIDNSSDAYMCAQLIAEEFVANEPMTVFDQLTTQYFFDNCSWPFMKDVLDERLSFLVRYRRSGEIVAAACAGDMYLKHKNHPYNASAPADAIAANDLVYEMDDIFVRRDFGQELKPNMVLHNTIGAVRAQHAVKGVARRLYRSIGDHARDTRGFQYALVQPTNPITRMMCAKINGKELTVVDPTTWQWKKKGDGLSCPYKDYKGGLIPNILLELN